MPTKTDHIFVINQGADGNTLTLERDYDLTSVLDEATERISSALPDFNGLIWFVSKANGKVGTLDPETGDAEGEDDWARRSRTRSRSARTASTSSPTSACTGSRPNGKRHARG